MPVYNCELYIKEAINSVLNQTFSDFELIIIDDCSTDNTVSVIDKFSDNRICLYKKEKNLGLIDSLNFGVSIAKGEYLARMDGDDICLPERFARQIDFLEKNPDIMLCGTAIKFIGSASDILIFPENHAEIVINLFSFLPTFAHPTVMGKKEIFEKNNYHEDYEFAEDYELWTRLVQAGKVANLKEVLLEYRVHPAQVSVKNKTIQDINSFKSRLEILKLLKVDSKYSEEEIIKFLVNKDLPLTITDCVNINKFYNFVILQNNELNVFGNKDFTSKLKQIKIGLFKQYFNRKRILHPKSLAFLFRNFTISELFILFKMNVFNNN